MPVYPGAQKTPFHSFAWKKAKEKRTLAQTPVFASLTGFPRNRTASEGVQGSMGAIGTDKRQGRAFVAFAAGIVGVSTPTQADQGRLRGDVEAAPPDPSRGSNGTDARQEGSG